MFRKMKMKPGSLLAAGLMATAISATAAPKTLLIGIDGVQYEKLRALNPPQFNRLQSAKAYTGGVDGAFSQQGTVSGPGWATILTGVWANKHQVASNDSGLADARFPSLFKRIRQAQPNAYIASITNWSPINQRYFVEDVADNNLTLSGLSDENVTSRVVEVLNTTPADFTFLQLSDPDNVGHAKCFGSEYDQALRNADRRLGRLLDAVAKRERERPDEDWLVLVSTDHGRTPPRGCGHGGQTEEEKTIFIATNKPLNAEFSQHAVPPEHPNFNGLYGYAAQASIAPTVLPHMGIESQPGDLLDGIPLTGALGVRKLMPAGGGSSSLRWHSTDAGTVSIRRNGASVANVPARQQEWRDPAAVDGVVDYTLVLNNTPVSLRRAPGREIQAALDWNTNRSFIFLTTGEYARYNQTQDRVDSGYPVRTSQHNWPGLAQYADRIVAGFSKDASVAYVFLDDGRYIRYNKTQDRADDGYPMAVNDNSWPGLGAYARQIRTALRWRDDRAFIFLKDGRYIRYNLTEDRADDGYPRRVNDYNWPGLEAYAHDIVSAMKWDDSRAYIFLTGRRYIQYNLTEDRVDDGYPRTVDDYNWPGLLP